MCHIQTVLMVRGEWRGGGLVRKRKSSTHFINTFNTFQWKLFCAFFPCPLQHPTTNLLIKTANMQLNWLKTTWSGELAPKTFFVAISSARVSKTASQIFSPSSLLFLSQPAFFCFDYFLLWVTGRRQLPHCGWQVGAGYGGNVAASWSPPVSPLS